MVIKEYFTTVRKFLPDSSYLPPTNTYRPVGAVAEWSRRKTIGYDDDIFHAFKALILTD